MVTPRVTWYPSVMPLLGRLSRGPQVPLATRATSAAPTAGTAVASIASVPAGQYIAHVVSRTTGATDEPKRTNLDVRSSANPAATVASGLNSGNDIGGYRAVRFDLTGSSTISVNATANATGSTTYDVCLILERLV